MRTGVKAIVAVIACAALAGCVPVSDAGLYTSSPYDLGAPPLVYAEPPLVPGPAYAPPYGYGGPGYGYPLPLIGGPVLGGPVLGGPVLGGPIVGIPAVQPGVTVGLAFGRDRFERDRFERDRLRPQWERDRFARERFGRGFERDRWIRERRIPEGPFRPGGPFDPPFHRRPWDRG